MTTPTRIYPFLYLGNHAAARNKAALKEMNITHLVSIGHGLKAAFELSAKKGKNLDFEYFVIDEEENEEMKLASYFDKVFKFIEAGREEGYILVHCATGDTYSAAIIAAFILKKTKISLQDALDTVTEARPTATFSAGVKQQLSDYHDKIHGISKTSASVKAVPPPAVDKPTSPPSLPHSPVTANATSASIPTSDSTDSPKPVQVSNIISPSLLPTATPSDSSIASQPTQIPFLLEEAELQTSESESSEPQAEPSKPSDLGSESSKQEEVRRYACRNCRTPLFSQPDLREHEVGPGQSSFSWTKRNRTEGAVLVCNSHFLDEMPWMGSCLQASGKLFCPHCNHKLGDYDWAGAQCSCGAWIAPAFQIAKNRVDVKKTDSEISQELAKSRISTPIYIERDPKS